jgi:hypothetical protein
MMDEEDLELAEEIYNHIMDCSHYQRQAYALNEMFGYDPKRKIFIEDYDNKSQDIKKVT